MGAKQTKKKGAYYPSKEEKSTFSKSRSSNQASTSSQSLPSIPGGVKQEQKDKYSIFQVARSQPNVSALQAAERYSDSDVEEDFLGDDGYSQVVVKDGRMIVEEHSQVDEGEDDIEMDSESETESSSDSVKAEAVRVHERKEESEESEETTDSESSESSQQSSTKLNGTDENHKVEMTVKGSTVSSKVKYEHEEEHSQRMGLKNIRNAFSQSQSVASGSCSETELPNHEPLSDNVSDTSEESEVTNVGATDRVEINKSKWSDSSLHRKCPTISQTVDNLESSLKYSDTNLSGEEQNGCKSSKPPTQVSQKRIPSDGHPETPRSVSSYDSGKLSVTKQRSSWLPKLKSLNRRSKAEKTLNAPAYGRSVSVPNFSQQYLSAPSNSEMDIASSSRSTTPRVSILSVSVGNIKKMFRSISKKDKDNEVPMRIGDPILVKATRDLQHITGKRIELDGLSPRGSEVESDMVAVLDLDNYESKEIEEKTDSELPCAREYEEVTKDTVPASSTPPSPALPDDNVNEISDDYQNIIENQTTDCVTPEADNKSYSSNSSDVFLPDKSKNLDDISEKEVSAAMLASHVVERNLVIGQQEDEQKRKSVSSEERSRSLLTPSEANFAAIHWPSLSSMAASHNEGSHHVENGFKGLQNIDNLRNRKFASHSLEDVRKPQLSLVKGSSLSSEQIHSLEIKDNLRPVIAAAHQKNKESNRISATPHSENSAVHEVVPNENLTTNNIKLIPDIHFRKRSTSYSSDSFYSSKGHDSNSGTSLKQETYADEAEKNHPSSLDTPAETSLLLTLQSKTADAGLKPGNLHQMTVDNEKSQLSTNEYVENWVVQSMSQMEKLESVGDVEPPAQIRASSASLADDENSSSENLSEAASVQSVVEKNVINLRKSSDSNQVSSVVASKDFSTEEVIYAPQSTSSNFTFEDLKYVKKEGERIVLVNMPQRIPEFRKSESNESDKLKSTLDRSLRTSHSVSDIRETDSNSETSVTGSRESIIDSSQGPQNVERLSQSMPVAGNQSKRTNLLSSTEPVQLKNADDILKYSIINNDKTQRSVVEEQPSKTISPRKQKGSGAVTETVQNFLHWGSSRIRKSFQRLRNSKKDQTQTTPKRASDIEDSKRRAFLKEALDPNVDAIFVGDAPKSHREETTDDKKKGKSNIKRTVSNIEVFSKSKFLKDDNVNEEVTGRKVSVITRTPEGYFTVEKRNVQVNEKTDEIGLVSATQLETASDSELEVSSQRKDPTYSELTILEKTTEGRVSFDPTSPRRSPTHAARKAAPPRPTSLPLRRKAAVLDGFHNVESTYATITRKWKKKGNVRIQQDTSDSDISDSESKDKPPVPPKSEDILLAMKSKNQDSASETIGEGLRQSQVSGIHVNRHSLGKNAWSPSAIEGRGSNVTTRDGVSNLKQQRNSVCKPPSSISSASPSAPPRRKKMAKQTSVISRQSSDNKSGEEPVEITGSHHPLLLGDEQVLKIPQETVVVKKEIICDIKPDDVVKSTKKQLLISTEIKDQKPVHISSEGLHKAERSKEGGKKTKESVQENVVTVNDLVKETPHRNTESMGSNKSTPKKTVPPPRPTSLPTKPKEKKPQAQKHSKPKENYKTKYKGSSLIQSRRDDERSISSQCSTDRSTRVLRELHNQLSISSLDTTWSSELTHVSASREAKNKVKEKRIYGNKKDVVQYPSVSSQGTTWPGEVTNVDTLKEAKNKVKDRSVKQQVSVSSQDNTLPGEVTNVAASREANNKVKERRISFNKKNVVQQPSISSQDTARSGEVTQVDTSKEVKNKVKETRISINKIDDVQHIYDEVPRKVMETLDDTSDHDLTSAHGLENQMAQRCATAPLAEENKDDSLVISEIPLKLQPKNRIPLRIKRKYPQYFEVPDDSDSIHSDSTECLSDLGTDMEGFYPAGLFEHVAKMSRLADADDLLAGDSPMVPPVRIRSNFVANSGRDMKVDTLNLARSQVKSPVTDSTKGPPTIAYTPPTPDVKYRGKTGLSGSVPPYEPGPTTSRKLSIEKDYIKDRMRRRDSESSAATAPSQWEASSNKENNKRNLTPESKDRHRHKRSTHKKHKKHKRKDDRHKRESSPDREKDKDERKGKSHSHSKDKKHRDRSRSHERRKSKPRSRSLDETASDTTLVGTEVSTVYTEVQYKDKKRDRSRKDKTHEDKKKRSRSHSHRRSQQTSKDSPKSERDSVKGRNMRALPHHSHQFTANNRPKNTELLDLLMDQQYRHQVDQEAQMAAKVLVNRAYKSPDKGHTPKEKKMKELLNDAYPLSQRSLDSAKDSTSLPPMSPTPGSSHRPESVQTEPVSGRRNQPRQRSESPPRAGSALERLLTEGSLVHRKPHRRPVASSGPKYPGAVGSGGAHTRWSSYPGVQPAWGHVSPSKPPVHQMVGVEKEVLLQAIREEIRLLHGREALKS